MIGLNNLHHKATAHPLHRPTLIVKLRVNTMPGFTPHNPFLPAVETQSQASFKKKAAAKGDQLNAVVITPAQNTQAIKSVASQVQASEAADIQGAIRAKRLPDSPAYTSAPCTNSTTNITSASDTSRPTPRVIHNQQLSEPGSQTPSAVNTSMSAPPNTLCFVTAAKRKRLESEASDVIITKTITKVPGPPPPPTYEELVKENKKLKEENHHLRLAHTKISSVDKVMTKFAISASLMETAVDVREKEMRKGLNAISEAMAIFQDQLGEMVKFSNGTTELVGRISQSANEDHEQHLSKAEAGRLQIRYENARPKQEVDEAIHERLSFTPKTRGRPKSFA